MYWKTNGRSLAKAKRLPYLESLNGAIPNTDYYCLLGASVPYWSSRDNVHPHLFSHSN